MNATLIDVETHVASVAAAHVDDLRTAFPIATSFLTAVC